MDLSVETLIKLRNRSLDDFVEGRIERDEYRADLAAIAVQVDRLLSTDGLASLEERAGRVVAEIIADSRAQSVAVPPAKAARAEFWHRRRVELELRLHPVTAVGLCRQRRGLDGVHLVGEQDARGTCARVPPSRFSASRGRASATTQAA